MIYKVFGPPGTGKTTHLIEKAKGYVEQGASLKEIGYFAFTKKAATEAKKRMPFENKKLTYFQTLHSLAFHTLGLKEENVMQPYHYEDLGKILNIRVHFEDKNNDQESFYLTCDNLYYQLIGRAKNKDISVRAEYCTNEYPREEIDWDILNHININLEQYKKRNNLIDFNDMIYMFIQQEEKCPKFKAIFIDEAQDLSPIQWKMFDILKNKTDDIYLAGDDDQAIYAWAGADVDRFIDEPADDEQVLEQSRRIPKAVQELSEIVLNRIEGKRKKKKYLPRDEEGSVEKIFNLDQIDLHTGNWLILSRTGSRLIEIMDLLREKGIYYQTKKGKSFKVNLYKCVLNYEKSKNCPLTDAELSDIKEYMGKDIINHDIPWYEAFEKAPQNEIQYIRLMLSNKEKLSLEPRVRLSTIHAAKGGEEDNVILILDNARKIRRAVQDSLNKRDEEHRVWYVAITRAKQKLYLHRAKIERNGYQL